MSKAADIEASAHSNAFVNEILYAMAYWNRCLHRLHTPLTRSAPYLLSLSRVPTLHPNIMRCSLGFVLITDCADRASSSIHIPITHTVIRAALNLLIKLDLLIKASNMLMAALLN